MKGFSLLEVMVALAILGIMLLVLLQVQASSARIAAEARDISIAVGLAKLKQQDCQFEVIKNGFSVGDYNKNGNFGDLGYAYMQWECHAYAFKPPMPDPAAIADKLANKKQGSGTNQGADLSASMLVPFFSMLSSALQGTVKELVTIVRVSPDPKSEEVRLVTHLVDTAAMALVAQGMSLTPGIIPQSSQQNQQGQSGSGATTGR